MKPFFKILSRLTSPATLTRQDGIAYWQEKVLLTLLLVIAVLGLITYIPSMLLSIKEKLWIIAVIDTLMYLFMVFLFFKKDLSYTFRASSVPVIVFLLGMVLIATLGPFGAGPVWLFFFPLITGILLGFKAAIFALLINLISIAGLGALIALDITDVLEPFNFKPWMLAPGNSLAKWIVVSLNFMLLNIIATLSVTTILKGLHDSMTDLTSSEKRYRQIYENILDVYFETRLDGTVIEASPSIENISKFTRKEFVGSSLLDRYKDLSKREETIELLLKKGHVSDHEIEFLDKDGKVVSCSINARLLPEDGDPSGRVIGILRDITEQKAMEKDKQALEERLNRSRKMEALGLLAGGVAHDLNNMLSGIVTYPELLAMDLDENDPMRKSLGIIQSSGQRATEIVQDLLTLSRRGVITREVLNLNDLVSGFLHTPEHKKIMSFHPNIDVETQIDAETPFLKGSPVHLQKTLMNLVSNASEAQIDGGRIVIKTYNCHLDRSVKGYEQIEAGDYIVLSVEDCGTGISQEDLTRIFEPFFTKKVMGRSGTGLGMAVVWGTVQDHEGYIDIISKPDQGTRFDLYFPISINEAVMPSKPIALEELKGNRETILVIDDIEAQRQIAGVALEKLGYKVNTVESGEKAVEHLRENNADLIILDMIMEHGIDGYETYKQIIEFKPGQKAIIASGFSQTQKVKDTLKLGAGCYLKKPYNIEKLGLAIKNELAGTA